MYPRCLKLTISPGCGFHRFPNSVVAAGAINLTPFGLCFHNTHNKHRKERIGENECQHNDIENGYEAFKDNIHFAFPGSWTDSGNNPCLCVSIFLETYFAEKVRYEAREEEGVIRYDTLCLRKPPDRPAC